MHEFVVLFFIITATIAAPQGYSYQTSTAFGPNGSYGAPAPAIITKNIYFHSAPDDSENDVREINLGPPRKNYRVIFIKAPAPGGSTISLHPAQDEEKTVIYVLSKKTDASDIEVNADIKPTEPSKPEVFFIKYRTPEEAAYAQNQIQSQYDALGGTSETSDEGIAPVHSVIGSLQRSPTQLSPSVLGSNRGYLPPNRIK